MIIGPSESGKTNALLNLIQKNNNNLIDKIYLYAEDLEETNRYQLLIEKIENAGIKNFNDPNAFIENFNSMDDVYDYINNYNPKRKRKVLIVFDGMIADIMTNKKFQAIIKELFIGCKGTKETFFFLLTINTTPPADDPMRFRKNFLNAPL